MMLARQVLAVILTGFPFLPGCNLLAWTYPDPDLAGKWYLTVSGPFSIAENRYLDFGRKELAYTYPERMQDLLNDLVLTLPGAPSSYSVNLIGSYSVGIETQPATIDYSVADVQINLNSLTAPLENYVRTMDAVGRAAFYASMAQKLGATRVNDIDSLISAIEAYQSAKLRNEFAPGFFGLYEVFDCDLLLQMALGTRPASLDNPLTFSRINCN